MGKVTCPYSYREKWKITLFCKLVREAPYCAHQYFCANSRRYEHSYQAIKCPLRVKAQGGETPTDRGE